MYQRCLGVAFHIKDLEKSIDFKNIYKTPKVWKFYKISIVIEPSILTKISLVFPALEYGKKVIRNDKKVYFSTLTSLGFGK